MTDGVYAYPGTSILINKPGLRDQAALDRFEREAVTQRASAGIPKGDFDLAHLKAIHRHLFQDVYNWAGQIRTVEISKDGHRFQFVRFIETGMADIHRRIVAAKNLRGLSAKAFAKEAGHIIGDVNYVHPFREGNGRTQLLYLKQLAERAGHPSDLRRLDRDRWHEASRLAHEASYDAMTACIAAALAQPQRRPTGRKGKGQTREH